MSEYRKGVEKQKILEEEEKKVELQVLVTRVQPSRRLGRQDMNFVKGTQDMKKMSRWEEKVCCVYIILIIYIPELYRPVYVNPLLFIQQHQETPCKLRKA